jgi:DNA repair protein RecN (Recombination protein N)
VLQLIRVKNYAVIDEVELELDAGFSVLTGETGAGKSILVDALGLALGDRADAGAVRHGAERAEISVLFECPSAHPAVAWLDEHGLDDDARCVLRRLITREGRSRAFINNQPVRLQDLRRIGALLVDIHGQHAHQSLLHAATQRRLLDAHGGLEEEAARTAAAFGAWRQAVAERDAQQADSEERDAQRELLRFQAAELEQLGLEDGEPAALTAEHSRLANVDRLLEGLSAALDLLYDSDSGSAYAQTAQARRRLEELVEHDPALGNAVDRLAAAEIELQETASDLTRYRERLEPDPARLDYVSERLAKIRALARRHKVDDEALPGVLPALRERLDALESGASSAAALAERADQAAARYAEAAAALSAGRRAAAEDLGTRVSAQLEELGMPQGRLRVAVEAKPAERGDANGIDRVEFAVRLNPGQPFAPLAKTASGGELSRISLALEVVLTDASSIPTFVFDEVDAGIGGGVAEIVGRRLREIAARRQVLCVTHLPQVASQGAQHFKVMKLTDGTTSRTAIRRLEGPERIEELSRMLGGVEITATTRAHAEEMMRGAAN